MSTTTVVNKHNRRKYWIAVKATERDIASESIGIMAHFTIRVRHQVAIYTHWPLPYLSRPALVIEIDDSDQQLGSQSAGDFVSELVSDHRLEELHDLRASLVYSRYGYSSHRHDLARAEYLMRKAPSIWLKRNSPSTMSAAQPARS